MISIKNKDAIRKMGIAGAMLAEVFDELKEVIREHVTTLDIDTYVAKALHKRGMKSTTKGYMGYKHVCCVSLNDEVVHGVPSVQRVLRAGDLVKVDICASLNGYCADMARPFFIGTEMPQNIQKFVAVAQRALDAGIAQVQVGSRLTNISAAVQREVEREGFSVVRDFAGHGIGKNMHEEPEILNYGVSGKGPIMQSGMAFAIEPMITVGSYEIFIDQDDWTAKTVDGSLAMHVEDTVIVTENGPMIVTRNI